MNAANNDHGGKRRRGMRLALVASLALNLLFLGVMAGGFIKAGRMGPPQVSSATDLRTLWRALPDEARQSIRSDQHGGGSPGARGARREQMQARNAEALALLRAEVFDAGAFLTLLEADHRVRAERLNSAHTALVGQLDGLAPNERAMMAERLEQMLRSPRPPR